MARTRPRRSAPFRGTPGVLAPLLAACLASGCALAATVAERAIPASGEARSSRPVPSAGGPAVDRAADRAAEAPPRETRAGSSGQVTSVFRWGPLPASVPEGAVEVSSLPWRLVGSLGRGAAQPLWRRDPPRLSPLSRPATGRLVTPLGPGGPSFAVQALFVVGGTPIGLAPSWWHSTPWLTHGVTDPLPVGQMAWIIVEIPLLRLFPNRTVPLFLF